MESPKLTGPGKPESIDGKKYPDQVVVRLYGEQDEERYGSPHF